MTHTPDCQRLGLTDGQYAALTGFTGRAVRALAHLREAWSVADQDHAAAIELAIRAIVDARELRRIQPLCARVLTAGFDEGRGAELLARVGVDALECS
ncbi:MAG TPA: hypothetical protein VE620_03340 [Myxococcales bacterium]|jgi:hypothetical protein|nr:hypothetical protein [Myxococcales bacterium]